MYTKQTHLFFFSRILFVRNHFAKKHKALKKIARDLMVTQQRLLTLTTALIKKTKTNKKGLSE